jgi:uncharacterized RDD family membrane protein YckC
MEYAGFWRRFASFWIDLLIILPPTLLLFAYVSGISTWFYAAWILPSTLFGLWFSVYLVVRYGGTPGKLLMKTKIVMLDGSPISRKAAFIRYAVMLFLSLLSSGALAYAALQIPEEQYFSLSYLQKSVLIVSKAPSWYKVVDISLQIWVYAEFFTVIFNKKRRAIHDFMAGTVVIKVTK